MSPDDRKSDEPLLFDLPLKAPEDEGATPDKPHRERQPLVLEGLLGERPRPPSRAQRSRDAGRDTVEGPAGPRLTLVADRGAAREGIPPALPIGPRLAAGLLDLGVHALTFGLTLAGIRAMGARLEVVELPAMALFLLLFSLLYHVVPLAVWGRTPGMASVGLAARSEEDGPLSFGQAGRRWLGSLASALLLGLPILFAPRGRTLTDRLSATRLHRSQR